MDTSERDLEHSDIKPNADLADADLSDTELEDVACPTPTSHMLSSCGVISRTWSSLILLY